MKTETATTTNGVEDVQRIDDFKPAGWFANFSPGALTLRLEGHVHGIIAEKTCAMYQAAKETLLKETFEPVMKDIRDGDRFATLQKSRQAIGIVADKIAVEKAKAHQARADTERLTFAGKDPTDSRRQTDAHDAEVARLTKWLEDLRGIQRISRPNYKRTSMPGCRPRSRR